MVFDLYRRRRAQNGRGAEACLTLSFRFIQGASVSQLIYALLRSVDLEEHWEDTWEDRLDNIKELVRSGLGSSPLFPLLPL